MDIHNTLLTSLRKLAKQHTEETLGDRRNYLGASDIGYCPRKTILERIHPGEHDLATLLRFQRGHMTEDIVAMAFSAAGFNNYERQVEIAVEGDVPLKAHIDFVLHPKPKKSNLFWRLKAQARSPMGRMVHGNRNFISRWEPLPESILIIRSKVQLWHLILQTAM